MVFIRRMTVVGVTPQYDARDGVVTSFGARVNQARSATSVLSGSY